MKIRQRNIFATIRTEGSILPADLLQRINDRDPQLKGLSPEDYHLVGNVRLNEAINQSWNRLLGAWAVFQKALAALPATDAGTTLTREKWLLPLFSELGYGRLQTSKAIEIDGRSYPISHAWQQTPIHLVSAKVKLDERTAGVAGAARISPHGMMQELLNRSEAHLWGFVSNGLQLRILRDNVSLTRQAYVEFDLEAMMNGEQYPDFTMLWLLCHESRVEVSEGERPESYWLEKWSKAAHEQGKRALENLFDDKNGHGVKVAIEAFGRGFLAHPANHVLLDKLRKGALDKQDYYRQLLRLVYRLLFLFVAEDRELLFAPASDDIARERYTRFYSVSRLRRLAERRLGTRHGDLYHSLRLVMQKLGNGGCSELGLPALGSFLFSDEATVDLNWCEIANNDLLDAVRALAFINDGHGLRTVDYKNLRSEELGSVYEALLELHPVINAEARQFNLSSASGNERKTTGSYYTPDSLVQCLLDSALDPVVDEAVRQPDPEAAILRLKVVDPACGSGHFLIAAAHRMAKRLAAIRTGDGEPSPEATRRALRDVIGHCIYGVDMNPMAVELCKVSLWMEALEPGKPLSFLDHHIQCGNSLIGATPALIKGGIPDDAFKPIEGDVKEVCNEYRKQNREERAGFQRLPFEPFVKLGNLAASIAELDAIDDTDISGVRAKQQRYEQLVKSSGYIYSQFLADAWCAAFVWKKTHEFPYLITEAVLREIEKNPFTHASLGCGDWLFQEVRRLAGQYRFLHWHLAFPDVFCVPVSDEDPENQQAGWSGGFNVVLGNPPWENIKADPVEFFATSRPDIAEARNATVRDALLRGLEVEDLGLNLSWLEHKRFIEGQQVFLANSGRFPFGASGKTNTMPLFTELFSTLISPLGRAGIIVKSVIGTDIEYQPLFSHLVTGLQVYSFYDFINVKKLFPDVHPQERFALITLLTPQKALYGSYAFLLTEVSDMAKEGVIHKLSIQDLAAMTSGACRLPTIIESWQARVLVAVGKSCKGSTFLSPLSGLDSYIMYDGGKISAIEGACTADSFVREESGGGFLGRNSEGQSVVGVYEGKFIGILDHRMRSFEGIPSSERYGKTPAINVLTSHDKTDQRRSIEPRYWVALTDVVRRLSAKNWSHKWAVLHGRKGNRDNQRTFSIAAVPICGSVDVSPFLVPANGHSEFPIINSLAVGQSFIFDFLIRSRLIGFTIGKNLLQEIPVPHLDLYKRPTPWDSRVTVFQWNVVRLLELVFTAWDLEGFAQDCGYQGMPFRWDEERRFLLRCELDAAYFHLYGIGREDVAYILDTFPIVRRKDEAQHSEYRTKRVILEIYDEMQQAITTGQPYQTRLDPPPANSWTPPALQQEETSTTPEASSKKSVIEGQEDLFTWQSENPQQQLKFGDSD